MPVLWNQAQKAETAAQNALERAEHSVVTGLLPGQRANLVRAVDAAIRDLRTARRAVIGEPRECESCGRVFIGRDDARFCDDACRRRAYRGRPEASGSPAAGAADPAPPT